MKITTAAFLGASIFLAPLVTTAQEAGDTSSTHIAQVTFAWPVGSAGTSSLSYSNYFSLNLLYGLNGGVKGVELGGALNFNKGGLTGLQLSGLANINTLDSKGLLMAGAVNINRQNVYGLQMAGFSNHSGGSAKGAMIAAFLNTARVVEGAQIAGFSNISTASLNGLQLAGFLNTGREIKGVQLAGFMNIAQTVKGVQIAPLLNIADSCDYPIALINIIKSGEQSISLEIDEAGTAVASFRSGGRVLYGLLGVGYNFQNEEARYALQGGLGAHVLQKRMFRLKAEGTALNLADFDKGDYFKASLKVLPSLVIGKFFEIYAGPSFNFVHTDQVESMELIDSYLWKDIDHKNLDGLYIGFTGGVNFIL